MLIPVQPLQPVQRVQAVPENEVYYTIRYTCIVGPMGQGHVVGEWQLNCDGSLTGWGTRPYQYTSCHSTDSKQTQWPNQAGNRSRNGGLGCITSTRSTVRSFLQHYHKRSKVETTFHMIKSSSVNGCEVGRTRRRLTRLCVRCFAITCCVTQSVHELGIETNFTAVTAS